MSLVARYLEEREIATVILGAARDIVEHCGVPRFLFTDFPLGNPCGKPYDREMQEAIVEAGLSLLESATAPRTTVTTPFVWSASQEWRDRYSRVDPQRREHYLRLGEERRTQRGAMREREAASEAEARGGGNPTPHEARLGSRRQMD